MLRNACSSDSQSGTRLTALPIRLAGAPGPMNDEIEELAVSIFTQMAAQHTVRHGVHDSRSQASTLARESFKLAEAFVQERHARKCAQPDERT